MSEIKIDFEKDIVLGCVAENKPKFLAQALRLVQSVRWFGGKTAKSTFIVCVINEVDPAYKRQFEKYGAQVRIVSPYNPKHPHSNKLRFLQLPELKTFSIVMLLDCDTLVVQDFGGYLSSRRFKGKIAAAPTISSDLFSKLFDFFHLPMPTSDYKCTLTGTPTIPYFNAGVLVFPGDVKSAA